MQCQTHQQYYLNMNIFLFLKINFICIKQKKTLIRGQLKI
jgi:hypothetical protein